MLDMVKGAVKAFAGKHLGEESGDLLPLAPVAEALDHQSKIRTVGDEVTEFPHQVGAAVLIDRHMPHIGEAYPCFAQAIGNGFGWKSCPMLHTPETLLFDRRDKVAVP